MWQAIIDEMPAADLPHFFFPFLKQLHSYYSNPDDEKESLSSPVLPEGDTTEEWFEKWKEENDDAFMTEEEIEARIASYEQKFGMTSEEFLRRIAEDNVPDEEEIIDWKLLLKYR